MVPAIILQDFQIITYNYAALSPIKKRFDETDNIFYFKKKQI